MYVGSTWFLFTRIELDLLRSSRHLLDVGCVFHSYFICKQQYCETLKTPTNNSPYCNSFDYVFVSFISNFMGPLVTLFIFVGLNFYTFRTYRNFLPWVNRFFVHSLTSFKLNLRLILIFLYNYVREVLPILF